jgi:hypothetical protein
MLYGLNQRVCRRVKDSRAPVIVPPFGHGFLVWHVAGISMLISRSQPRVAAQTARIAVPQHVVRTGSLWQRSPVSNKSISSRSCAIRPSRSPRTPLMSTQVVSRYSFGQLSPFARCVPGRYSHAMRIQAASVRHGGRPYNKRMKRTCFTRSSASRGHWRAHAAYPRR